MWKPLEGPRVWLCWFYSELSAGPWAAPTLAQRFYLPWIQSRPKSKGGLFLKPRPDIGTQRALCFGAEAFKDLFSLNILLQEREAPNQTFLKLEFQVALKEQFVWFPSHPVSAQWGLGHLSLGFDGGSPPFQAHCPASLGGCSVPDPARGPLVTTRPRGRRCTSISGRGGHCLSILSWIPTVGHTLFFEPSL